MFDEIVPKRYNTRMELTIEELSKMGADSYALVDIRDEAAYAYGHIPCAINMHEDKLALP